MINKVENSPSFGWRYKMHADIALAAGKKFGRENPDVLRVIEKSVIKPDFDEAFFYSQNHFYYPNSKIKSFLDLTGEHNAKSYYNKHIQNFRNLLNNDYDYYAANKAGRALHYLQDITQPQHIENTSVLKKWQDKDVHIDFEQFAYDEAQSLIKEARPQKFKSKSFEELFDDAVNVSLENKVPNRDNRELWGAIAYDSVNVAMGATKRFFEILHSLL